MALTLPKATVTVENSGIGLVAAPPDQVHVLFGCSSGGPLLQPRQFADPKLAAATFKTGPLVKAAASALAKTKAVVYLLRLPATAVSAFTSAIDKTGVVGTAVPTVSGTPKDGYDIQVVITTAGTVGTSFSYKYSLDGGQTFTAPIAASSSVSLVLTGTGLTIGLTSTQTFVLNDTFVFWTLPASASIQPVTTTRVGSSTCAITATGSPQDAYEVLFQVLAGGTIGTAGITFRYSLDNGGAWSGTIALGTATSYLLIDGPNSTESSGVTLNFASGTLDLLDTAACTTSAPEWQWSDAAAALDNLRASNAKWRFLHAVGTVSPTTAASLGSKLADWAAGTKYTFAVCSVRDRGTYEGLSIWSDRVDSAWSLFGDDRISPWGGYQRITCPLTGRSNRRSVAWSVVPRLIANAIQVDPGQKSLGPLSSDTLIHDANNVLVEHDARIDPTLHAAGFGTLRTYEDEVGVFVTRGNLKCPDGSDFNRIAYRAVMDKASAIYRRVMEEQLELGIGVNKADPNNNAIVAGTIREPDARKIDREIRTQIEIEMVTTGEIVDVDVHVSRTDVVQVTGKISCETVITPLAYIDEFDGVIRFASPTLSALVTA